MRKFLATTALTASLIAGSAGVYAADMSPLSMYQQQPTDIQASEFIGTRLYATEDEVATDGIAKDGVETDWDDIGEVNEVILSRQGEVKAVVLGVGGFLGIGEKDVAIPMKDIVFVRDGEDADDYFLVVRANKQTLTDAPAYEAPEQTADAAATQTAARTPATAPSLVRPDVEREGYRTTERSDLTSENLTGAQVYSANDEDVGEVDKLLLNDDGSVKQVVMDIGGFLGVGEHRIAVDLDQVNILRSENGSDVRVYIDSTEAALKAQPEYNGQ